MNTKAKQLSLFNEMQVSKTFGGQSLVGKRKSKRPLSTKLPIHLILRANQQVKRKQVAKVFSFRGKKNNFILNSVAKRFQVKVYQSVFNHTHLHLIIVIPSRHAYIGFVRILSAKLSGLAGLPKGQLFALRPYTRIASWGRQFQKLINYMKKNSCEAIGGVDVLYSEIPYEICTI
jgi:REP element-mobilizing transposase RayT